MVPKETAGRERAVLMMALWFYQLRCRPHLLLTDLIIVAHLLIWRGTQPNITHLHLSVRHSWTQNDAPSPRS
jgi:hypothetical protein